jgi:hypothetical protein
MGMVNNDNKTYLTTHDGRRTRRVKGKEKQNRQRTRRKKKPIMTKTERDKIKYRKFYIQKKKRRKI